MHYIKRCIICSTEPGMGSPNGSKRLEAHRGMHTGGLQSNAVLYYDIALTAPAEGNAPGVMFSVLHCALDIALVVPMSTANHVFAVRLCRLQPAAEWVLVAAPASSRPSSPGVALTLLP
jgi:hypothetical protein